MKSIIKYLVVLLAGAGLTIGGYFFFSSRELGDESFTVTFTEAQIQNQIGKDFPKKEKILNYIPVVIQEPIVKFLGETKRVQLTVTASIAIPFIRSEDITGIFTGSIRYEKEDNTLRTSDLTVEKLSTSSLPEKYEEAVKAALTISARKYLDDHIVHTIKPEDTAGAMADMFLQKIKVKNGRLEIILGL